MNLLPYDCIGGGKKTVGHSVRTAYKNYKAAKQLCVEGIALRLYLETMDYSLTFRDALQVT